MSAFRRYILLALLTGFSGPGFPTAARAAGTAPDAPDFNFTHYNSGNSELPYDRVNKIVQDSQGFIWFGTSSGLSRFDGIRFRNYTKEEMGLKSAYVIALCTDSEGNLWIGTDRGVSVYDVDRDRFEPFLRESDLGTVIRNKANGRRTWLYVDEFHRFFSNQYAAAQFKDIYKRARKYGLGVTGITQNVEEILDLQDAREMLSNSDFLMLLSQNSTDADALCELLTLSEEQRQYFTGVLPGQGLMKIGSAYVPFDGRIPAGGDLYRLYSTTFQEGK